MRIELELTAEDFTNCHAMMLVAKPPAKNRGISLLTAAYGVGGGLLFFYFFHLSIAALVVLLAYVLGLVWLIVLALKLAQSQQIAQTSKEYSLRREYLLTETGLEIRMPDLTQIFPFSGIVKLESRERGTLVHLAKCAPTFLPFGTSFRSDFVDALKAKTKTA